MDQGRRWRGASDRISSSEGDTHEETSIPQRRSRIRIVAEEKLGRTQEDNVKGWRQG